MPVRAQTCTEELCMPSRRILFNVKLFGLIRVMFDLFPQYLCLEVTERKQNFIKETCLLNRRMLPNVDFGDFIWTMFWQY